MRERSGTEHIQQFMKLLGERCGQPADVYFTGGACAVLLGWRTTTMDLDIKVVSAHDDVLRLLPAAKESLSVNIELAAPDDFVPPLPGWEDRRVFITTVGRVSFYHYDFYAQALSKIERGHAQDRDDVRLMVKDGRVKPPRLLELFALVEAELFRYPAIDPRTLRMDVEAFARGE